MTKCWVAQIRVSEQPKPARDWTEANPKGQGEYKTLFVYNRVNVRVIFCWWSHILSEYNNILFYRFYCTKHSSIIKSLKTTFHVFVCNQILLVNFSARRVCLFFAPIFLCLRWWRWRHFSFETRKMNLRATDKSGVGRPDTGLNFGCLATHTRSLTKSQTVLASEPIVWRACRVRSPATRASRAGCIPACFTQRVRRRSARCF